MNGTCQSVNQVLSIKFFLSCLLSVMDFAIFFMS